MAKRRPGRLDELAVNLLAAALMTRIVWRLTRGRAPWQRAPRRLMAPRRS